MAKINRIKAGQTLYVIRSQGMGNTTMTRRALYTVSVIEVANDFSYVVASIGGNTQRKYFQRDADKWRVNKPAPKGERFGLATY